MNMRTLSTLLFFLLLPLSLPAQSLPLIPSSCRSEQDERLAFGLCPDRTFDFYASGPYRSDIPRPEAILGYPIGSWHTTYGRMEQYLDTLQRSAPDRVRVFDYGRSVEYHTMHLVAISNAEHIANLEDIRTRIHRLADPTAPAEEVERLVRTTPAIVWLNAANDGNETAAFEAAIQLAYQLAAGEDERTRRIREHTVVLINLAHNPESHERMVAWYNAFVSGDADPIALEHQPPWGMSTNNNHYQIDLNRDALGLTQTESRAVAAALHFWRPQVFVDLHGQTTQYFFPPAAIPINPVYPEQMNKWLEIFGRANAAAFDQFGWSYYTRDIFDLYYPGYWDTYPALNGAIGMTYETDGGGNRGVRWRRDDGTILTFADGIAHHFVAALTTAETTARHREARLRDYHAFFTSALEEARRDPIKAFFLPRDPDPRKTDQLVTTLLRHEVEVHQLLDPARVTVISFSGKERKEVTFPAGTYVIYTAQKNYRIVKNLLAPDIPLPETFKKQELRRMARNLRLPPGEQERYAFYDLTAWNLPMGMNVSAYWTSERPRLATHPIELPEGWATLGADWSSETPFTLPYTLPEKRARSAYVWRPDTEGALRLLARLLDEGFKVAVAERPLMVGERDFPRGTFIARVGRNPETLHERIRALARDAGVEIYAADTAFPERGPTGTGSESTRSLRPPRVGILAGEGVSPTSYGAVWYYFERRLHYPFTALRVTQLSRIDLTPFDVLILPNGRFQGIDRSAWDKLKAWVQEGGVLIGYAGGARAILRANLGTSHESLTPPPPPADTLEAIIKRIDALVGGAPESPLVRSPEARPDAPIRVPGAFLRAYVDPEHWLTAGYSSRELPVLVQQLPFPLTRKGINAVVFAEGARLRLSGFIWPDNTQRNYAGKAYATVDEVGAGKVILLAEDPLFRIVFDGPSRLLTNSVFLGARGYRRFSGY